MSDLPRLKFPDSLVRFIDELPAWNYHDTEAHALWRLADRTDITDIERGAVRAAFDRRRERRLEEFRKSGPGLPGVGFACDSSD